jgi:hypothetical protein
MGDDFLSRMSDGDKAIAGGSLVVLVALFLPWYGIDTDGFSDAANGFHRWGLLAFLAWLAVASLSVARHYLDDTVHLPALPAGDAVIAMACGAVEMLGVLFVALDLPPQYGLRFGAFVALAGGAATLLGGYLNRR